MLSLKFWLSIAGLIGLISLVWYAHHSGDRRGYERATAEMEAKVIQANEATRLADIVSHQRVRKVESEYEDKLGELDAKYRDAADRLGAIRLCKPTSGSQMPRSRPAPSVPDGGPRGDQLPEATPSNLGPALVAMARDADACAARLAGLQEYVRSLP